MGGGWTESEREEAWCGLARCVVRLLEPPLTALFAYLRTHIVLFTAAPTERKRMFLATFPI